jgi:serine/threonine protein kinase
MAPEVTYSKGCLESDIWSLGIVYYECIHNTLPYHSINYDKSNFHQLFEKIRNDNIMIRLDLDLSIIGIFKIMLSRDTSIRKNCYHKIYEIIKGI